MYSYISIATLNDYIFCPYSIYLHSVYMEADDVVYKAVPQVKGSLAHESVDQKTSSTRKSEIQSLSVFSDEFGLNGKIDLYRSDKHLLIERKYNLKNIYRGQIYQIWAQFFCMQEMGYEVEQLAFYEISTNQMKYIQLPNESDKKEFSEFIEKFKAYKPDADPISINQNKCRHCIYCNLCDKTDNDNVYI